MKVLDENGLIILTEKMRIFIDEKVSVLEEQEVPKRLNSINIIDKNSDRTKAFLYIDNNGINNKISINDLLSTKIKTVDTIPSDLQTGDYIFLKTENEKHRIQQLQQDNSLLTLYPETTADNVIETSDKKFVTSDQKTKIDTIEQGAQINKVETISINGGTKIKPDATKNVDLTVAVTSGIKLTYNATNGAISLLDKNDIVLSTIDLPLELLIKSGTYNNITKNIELVLANGEKILVAAADLVDEYSADDTTITMDSSNKFSIAQTVLDRIVAIENTNTDQNKAIEDIIDGTTKVTKAENADVASKLQTAKNIELINDVSGSASFDGSDNITINTTLANVGIAGKYSIVETDAKGRVIKGSNITKADIGLGNVANELQYSANNQPPYPVTSVNGKTGNVNIDIPTVGNGIIIINQNNVKKGEFTLNQTDNLTLNLTDTIYNDATQSASGLFSSIDKKRLDDIWKVWSSDNESDTLVNKVTEVLDAFESFPEGSNIVTLLAGKQPAGNYVTYNTVTSVNVAGTVKSVSKYNPSSIYIQNGLVMGGTAQSAGLVTRGISGVTTPDANGACAKDHLFINYDGTNTFNTNRQIVLQASGPGTDLGNNMYQYGIPRGDIIKAYGDAHYMSKTQLANDSTIGGFKTGYSNTGKNYRVQLDSNGKAYVNVPWTDTIVDISGKADTDHFHYWGDIRGKPVYATVASTGKYSDLSEIPTTFTPAVHTHDYLPLSGGTLTGNVTFSTASTTGSAYLAFGTPKYNSAFLTIDGTNTDYGHNLTIGSGGRVIIGSGESAAHTRSNFGVQQDSEMMYVTSDESVYILSNCQNGYSSAKTFRFLSNGNFDVVNGGVYENNQRVYSPNNKPSWDNITGKPTSFTPDIHNHDSTYAALGHTHDDRYYTESEIDSKLSGKADSGHTHDYAASNHNHDSIYASLNHSHASVNGVTPEWSGQVYFSETNWLAAWTSDGNKIKALDKNEFMRQYIATSYSEPINMLAESSVMIKYNGLSLSQQYNYIGGINYSVIELPNDIKIVRMKVYIRYIKDTGVRITLPITFVNLDYSVYVDTSDWSTHYTNSTFGNRIFKIQDQGLSAFTLIPNNPNKYSSFTLSVDSGDGYTEETSRNIDLLIIGR